jgi:hypothetical protein
MSTLGKRLRDARVGRAIGGLLLGGALMAAFLSVVGPGEVSRALWRVPPARLGSLLLVGVAPLVFWGIGLQLVFGRLGRPLPIGKSVLLFSASGFCNAITPFGQAGGDPLAAVLFGRAIGADFETGLAAIGSLNAINRIATVFLGLLGVGYLGSTLTAGGSLGRAALVVAGLAIAGTVVLLVCWRYRRRLVGAFAAVLAPIVRGVVRLVPGADPPARESIERRGRRFVGALERIASDPVRLTAVFGLAVAGQLAVASALWVALASFGADASLAVVLLVIPIAKVGAVAPTPGGVGSTEGLLAMLLVSTTGASPPTAGATVMLYRLSAFWLPGVGGGLAAGWFLAVGSDGGTGDRFPSGSGVDDGTSETGRGEGVEGPSAVPRMLLAIVFWTAVLVTVVLHRGDLFVEPDSLVVHLTRDAALVALSVVVTWSVLRRLPSRWFG